MKPAEISGTLEPVNIGDASAKVNILVKDAPPLKTDAITKDEAPVPYDKPFKPIRDPNSERWKETHANELLLYVHRISYGDDSIGLLYAQGHKNSMTDFDGLVSTWRRLNEPPESIDFRIPERHRFLEMRRLGQRIRSNQSDPTVYVTPSEKVENHNGAMAVPAPTDMKTTFVMLAYGYSFGDAEKAKRLLQNIDSLEKLSHKKKDGFEYANPKVHLNLASLDMKVQAIKTIWSHHGKKIFENGDYSLDKIPEFITHIKLTYFDPEISGSYELLLARLKKEEIELSQGKLFQILHNLGLPVTKYMYNLKNMHKSPEPECPSGNGKKRTEEIPLPRMPRRVAKELLPVKDREELGEVVAGL